MAAAAGEEGRRGTVFSVLSMSDCEELSPIVEGEYVHVSDEQHLPTLKFNGTSNFNLNKKASTLPDRRQGQSTLMAEYDFTRDLIRPRSLSHGHGPMIESSKPLLEGS